MDRADKCVFCEIPASAYLLSNDYFYVIADKRPVSKGHSLVISKRHVLQYFDLCEEESVALLKIVNELKDILKQKYSPKAYNLMMNCGSKAGQTVFHYHMHVIPRY
ncbi:MAG: HIT family protein [Candidatus Cloacimonetes bacterium]|nr:HIT family protein [Candidatus Cloacimonadota bacterium]